MKILPATSRAGTCLASLDIFVLAGGLGTRIRSVLGDTPKLLATLAGRPYLDHLLDWLQSFGAKRVVLGLGYQADAVVDYLRKNPRSDLALSYVIEPRPLGTAGAIRFARDTLKSDPVVVMNGDSFSDADLCAMLAQHRNSGASGTVLCAKVARADRYGRVAVDRNGAIQRFIEKDPTFSGPALVNAGIYLLSAALLDQIASDETVSLERDIFEHLSPGELIAFTALFPFIDIGTPESLALAGKFFESHYRSMRGL
jgi:mannose-1-phosphate guanylyltransferase